LNLEECYDQIIHPQKRQSVHYALETVISRMVEINKLVVKNYHDFIKFKIDKDLKVDFKTRYCE
jgi:hypothetical protein